jgi:hypothetical protein
LGKCVKFNDFSNYSGYAEPIHSTTNNFSEILFGGIIFDKLVFVGGLMLANFLQVTATGYMYEIRVQRY